MNRRVFMKSGAMALATMGLNPTFLRRTVFAQDLLKGAALNGNARGKVLISLPGSQAAVKLAMEKLVLNEIRHMVSQVQGK